MFLSHTNLSCDNNLFQKEKSIPWISRVQWLVFFFLCDQHMIGFYLISCHWPSKNKKTDFFTGPEPSGYPIYEYLELYVNTKKGKKHITQNIFNFPLPNCNTIFLGIVSPSKRFLSIRQCFIFLSSCTQQQCNFNTLYPTVHAKRLSKDNHNNKDSTVHGDKEKNKKKEKLTQSKTSKNNPNQNSWMEISIKTWTDSCTKKTKPHQLWDL